MDLGCRKGQKRLERHPDDIRCGRKSDILPLIVYHVLLAIHLPSAACAQPWTPETTRNSVVGTARREVRCILTKSVREVDAKEEVPCGNCSECV